MIVKCIGNQPILAKDTFRYVGSESGNNSDVYLLDIGKNYSVYGVAVIDTAKMYLVLDETQDINAIVDRTAEPDPAWYGGSLFEVVDNSIDDSWKSYQGTVWTKKGETTTFSEFAEAGNRFYENLLDGSHIEINIFAEYVKKYEIA